MDIIDQIDAALSCHMCGGDLADSVSDMFCSEWCQVDWLAARAEPLQGYEEPYDLPQHAVNQIELRSPETTPEDDYRRFDQIDAAIFARALAGNLRRRRAASTLYAVTNPDRPTSWLEDAVRAQLEPVRRRMSDTIAAWVERFVGEAPVLSHATVDRDGTVTWHLEPWQRDVLAQNFTDPLEPWRAVVDQIRTDALASEPFRRVHLTDVVHARRCVHEDQAAVEPDVRARALDRVRNRNTGPAPRHQRPPRHL